MRRLRMPVTRAAVAIGIALGSIAALAAPLTAAAVPSPTGAAVAPPEASASSYPGDAKVEALLGAAEGRRVIDVRSISNAARATNVNQGRPYRLATGSTYTLVLIQREAAYTLTDLLEYAPSTFVRQPDGSYLLTENIVVEQGATLDFSSEEGLVLHLASDSDAFVSIVTLGGTLSIAGTADNPVEVTSWDPVKQAPDTDTTDGRAYLRVTGGHAAFAHTAFSHLGFWAGSTGGVALTGTAAPDVLSTDVAANRSGESAEAPQVFGSTIYPSGGAELLSLTPDLEGYSYVSAALDHVVSSDNAFGMFISSAVGVDIRDSTFENNLVDGLVLHRGVTNTVVHNTRTSRNGVDGISVTRAATGVVLDRITADKNGRNGITLEGGPLADGPSATGTPIGDYGNNTVSDSSLTGNARYAIEVIGGEQIVLDGNTVTDHDSGIVIANDVTDVTVTDNIVENSTTQGIALRGGVVGAVVQGNSVDGGEVGIYLRDASGRIDRNAIDGVSNHGITLIRGVDASTVSNNVLSGRGPSAVDVSRALVAPTLKNNDAEVWTSTKPLDVILRGIFQPLTVMWLLLGAAVVVTALTGLRYRSSRGVIRHPYESHRPLDTLTSGVIDPATVGRGTPRPQPEESFA